jgi:hypothetical protein
MEEAIEKDIVSFQLQEIVAFLLFHELLLALCDQLLLLGSDVDEIEAKFSVGSLEFLERRVGRIELQSDPILKLRRRFSIHRSISRY